MGCIFGCGGSFLLNKGSLELREDKGFDGRGVHTKKI
jgi:hypothetical protein